MNTDRVIEFILNANWHDFPDEIQHQSKRCLMDALGAMIAGTQAPVCDTMTKVASSQMGQGNSTLIVKGIKLSSTGAALANGFAANALDIDDGCRLAKGHPGASVLPVALAAAESTDFCNGQKFLTALIIGYEIAIRAAYIRHATTSVYHSSGSWGAIGGAAAAGKLMELDKNTLFNALGTSEYHAPIAPMMKGIETACMAKDSIGWGAFVAMTSVEMARAGFTGIRPIFDDSPNQEWIDSLGKRFEIMNLFFKPYAACRWAQPGVDGVLKIMEQENLTLEEIREIRIYTFGEAAALSRKHPQNTEDAQYNFSYPIAAAMFDGRIGPEQILPPKIFDKDILAMMDKIKVIVEERFQNEFPAKTLANIKIEDTRGCIHESGIMSARWDLSNKLPSDMELEQKFLWLVKPILGEHSAKSLVDMIWKFENIDTISKMITLCIK